jgi:ABC-type amino acid transport substrate-binding protein
MAFQSRYLYLKIGIMKKLIPVAAFLVLASLLTASVHSNTEPIWKQNLDKEVEWTQLTSIGVLLVGTSDWGLHGFDAKSGKLLWSNEKIYNSAKSLKGPDGKKVGYQSSMLRILEDEANPKYSPSMPW